MCCSQLWQCDVVSGSLSPPPTPPHPSVLSPEGFLQAFLWVITAILVLGAAGWGGSNLVWLV